MSDNNRGLVGTHEKASNVSWVSILVPTIVLLSIAVIVIIAISHRRDQLTQHGLSLDNQGRLALERDILEHGLSHNNSDDHTDSADRQDSRLPRTTNRWAWANVANVSNTLGGINSRHEEGLNEFGEAPPPYEPPSSTRIPLQARAAMQEERESGSAIAMPDPIHTSTMTREEEIPSPSDLTPRVSAIPVALPPRYSTARLPVEAK